MLECKVLHHRAYHPERTEKFRCERHLSVSLPTEKTHVKGIRIGPLMGMYPRDDFIVREPEPGTAKTEVLCCAHGLEEAWGRERELVEERDLELL